MGEEEEVCIKAMMFSTSEVFPMVLKAAIDLNLFDLLLAEKEPQSAAEIVAMLSTKAPHKAASRLNRVLHLLASHSLLSWSRREAGNGRVEVVYGLRPESHFFLAENEKGSFASIFVLSWHPAIRETWMHLKDAIIEGGNQFKKVHGMSVFQYMDVDPEFNKLFNRAMADLSTIVMTKFVEKYEGFKDLASSVLVDVAGGTGKCLNMIISKYPLIKGINFDLPQVTQNAPSYPGIQQVGGDMFSSIPKGNTIMIKDTLHNWDDENCIKILRRCHEALPEKGKAIVINMIMPEEPDISMASQCVSRFDLTMLTLAGGQERTASEFESLCLKSGFRDFQVLFCFSSLLCHGVLQITKYVTFSFPIKSSSSCLYAIKSSFSFSFSYCNQIIWMKNTLNFIVRVETDISKTLTTN